MISSAATKVTKNPFRLRLGNREIVGPHSGTRESYFDRVSSPCPSIRWKAPNPVINALREKEKGSWMALTLNEKKDLYRASFCQTFKEVEAPTCEPRKIFGRTLMLISAPLLLFVALKKTVFPPLPDSMSDEGKKKLVRWYIDARVDPMEGGISSKWDYENNRWKERPFLLMKSK